MNAKPDALIEELKTKLIECLGLQLTPAEIDPEAPLFGAGLGIDSVDALELMVMVEKDYGVRIEDRATGIEAFASVRALAEHIAEQQKPAST